MATNVRSIYELDQRTRAGADLLPSDRARALDNEQDRNERERIMKVIEKEYSVTSYDRTLKIEREGESYWVSVHWDSHDGYECNWFNESYRFTPTPQWAIDLEEEGTEPLGYRLELMAEGESKC